MGTCIKAKRSIRFDCGRGFIECSNGDVYDGNWSEDKRHGFGTMTTFTSGMTYTGTGLRIRRVGMENVRTRMGTCTKASGRTIIDGDGGSTNGDQRPVIPTKANGSTISRR